MTFPQLSEFFEKGQMTLIVTSSDELGGDLGRLCIQVGARFRRAVGVKSMLRHLQVYAPAKIVIDSKSPEARLCVEALSETDFAGCFTVLE